MHAAVRRTAVAGAATALLTALSVSTAGSASASEVTLGGCSSVIVDWIVSNPHDPVPKASVSGGTVQVDSTGTLAWTYDYAGLVVFIVAYCDI